jgi:gluconolactonase
MSCASTQRGTGSARVPASKIGAGCQCQQEENEGMTTTTRQEEYLELGEPEQHDRSAGVNRRRFLAGLGAGAVALSAGAAMAQSKAVAPPTTVSNPPRDFSSNGAPTTYFWDPDVIAIDPSFNGLAQPNAAIQRLWVGALWAEGPAWNSVGRYLVWSDIPNNRQMRWIEDDGHVSVFRTPSNNSNGNTFDYQGRQLSCEHLNRRVVRFEHDGTLTVIADAYTGRRLNSPNDLVTHPDGSVWFTDPPYGTAGVGGYEGDYGELFLQPAVYRVDPTTGQLDKYTDLLDQPNGLCFSPDHRRLYVVDTGTPRDIKVFDVLDDHRLVNGRQFTDMYVDGVAVGPDGLRVDIDGNVWAAAGWAGAGFDGVLVFAPDGTLIGQIRLPEACANVCFGGPTRNRLFMTASQSLYALYVNTRGAHVS